MHGRQKTSAQGRRWRTEEGGRGRGGNAYSAINRVERIDEMGKQKVSVSDDDAPLVTNDP